MHSTLKFWPHPLLIKNSANFDINKVAGYSFSMISQTEALATCTFLYYEITRSHQPWRHSLPMPLHEPVVCLDFLQGCASTWCTLGSYTTVLWEKGPLGIFIFIKIEFLARIDSSMCAESNGASFMGKYWSQMEIWPFLYTQVDVFQKMHIFK